MLYLIRNYCSKKIDREDKGSEKHVVKMDTFDSAKMELLLEETLAVWQRLRLLHQWSRNTVSYTHLKQEFLKKIPKKIYASEAGVVTSINLTKGVLTNQEQPIAVISSTDQLQLRLSVNEANISDVKTGQKVTITGSGFQDKEYHGTVQSISSVAKQVKMCIRDRANAAHNQGIYYQIKQDLYICQYFDSSVDTVINGVPATITQKIDTLTGSCPVSYTHLAPNAVRVPGSTCRSEYLCCGTTQ